MKLTSAILAALAIATTVSATGCEKKQPPALAATTQPAPDDSQNAWPKYSAIYDGFDKDFVTQLTMGAPATPDAAMIASLKAHKTQIDELIVATKLPNCSFGQAQDSVNDLVPPLAVTKAMRGLLRLLIADSHRCLAESNPPGCAFRAGAMLRMGRHQVIAGHSLIDILIANVAVNAGLELVNKNLDMNMLPGTAKDELREAIAKLDEPDFLHAKTIFQADRDMYAKSLRSGAPNMKGMSNRDWSAEPASVREEVASAIEKVTSQELAAWDRPDAVSAIETIENNSPANVRDFAAGAPQLRKSIQNAHENLLAAKKKVTG
jgi:hypothetical protein